MAAKIPGPPHAAGVYPSPAGSGAAGKVLPAGLRGNKVLLYGLGGAAGVGALVLVMRKRGSSAPGGTDTSGSGATTLQPGTYDSTGTDIYNGLQNITAGWTSQFTDLAGQLTDVQSRLPAPGSAGGSGTGTSTALLARKTTAGATATTRTAPAGSRWSWANLVAQYYNVTGASPAQVQAAAAKLANANKGKWFNAPRGPNMPYTSASVRPGQAVSLPGQL